MIAPQLSGYVSEVYVHDFQDVKQGDPIARIDDRIYRQKLAQAQAGLETADSAGRITAPGEPKSPSMDPVLRGSLWRSRGARKFAVFA